MSYFGYSFGIGSLKKSGGTGNDADAQAFIDAASITDDIQITAINTLVLDLKSYGLWSKCSAIYPIVGGTSSSHAVNLKTPGTFNLTFSTGWTHSSTGMTPNGSAYANTGLTPSTTLALNDAHLSYYSRTNINGGVDIGSTSVIGYDQYCTMIIRDNNNFYNNIHTQYNNWGLVSNTNSQGFFNANRTAVNVQTGFKNGIKIMNKTNSTDYRPTVPIYIGALNNGGTASDYCQRECAFASIGQGFTDAESGDFNTAIQSFQTTLERVI